MFEKKYQHVIYAAQNFLKNKLDLDVDSFPKIQVDDKKIIISKNKFNIREDQINILLGIGGSGQTKRIPSKIFIEFMRLVSNKLNNCRFFLATGKNYEEQKILKEILNSKFNKQCTALDSLDLKEILPIIVEKGWILPVTPGTKYVSIGGMAANNINGKNTKKNQIKFYYITKFKCNQSYRRNNYKGSNNNCNWSREICRNYSCNKSTQRNHTKSYAVYSHHSSTESIRNFNL